MKFPDNDKHALFIMNILKRFPKGWFYYGIDEKGVRFCQYKYTLKKDKELFYKFANQFGNVVTSSSKINRKLV